MSEKNGNATIERESKQPRFDDEGKGGALSYVMSLNDWAYRKHLSEPAFTSDTREYDDWLYDFASSEPHLMGILSSVVSKDSNRGWELLGGSRQVRLFGDRLRYVEDGAGWRVFMSKQARSYYNTNLGSITEIERLTASPDSPLLSLYHVDPTRVRLLGRNDKPIRYYPAKGTTQDWEHWEFFRTMSNPDIRESWRDVGWCAVSRCLSLAKMMLAVYEHDLEMLGAEPPKGFLTGSGITKRVWADAIKKRREARRNGEEMFDVDVVALFGEQAVSETSITFTPYSQLPTNFDLEQFTYLIMLGYALAFGYDAQEFYPVKQGSFGRGQEANIQAEKSTYKGEADFTLSFQDKIQLLLPDTVDFTFDRNDKGGDRQELDNDAAYVAMIDKMYRTRPHEEAVLTRDEYRSLVAGRGVIPAEWTEVIDMDVVTDTERLRYKTRWNDGLIRSAEQFPDEPIIHYHFNPKTNNATVKRLWDTGKQLRDSHRVFAVPDMSRIDRGDGTYIELPGESERFDSIDPVLNAIVNHESGCDCHGCDLRLTRAVFTIRRDIQWTIRQAQEGDVLYQDEDDEDFIITTGDVDLAIEEAGERVSELFEEILNAQEQDVIRNFLIHRAITWDSNSSRYRNDNGTFVSSARVRDLTRLSIDANGETSATLSARLANGEINTADARLVFREELKREYIRQAVAGRGGRDQMTQSDWGRLGAQLRTQYSYMNGFMDAIDSSNLTEGQIRMRMQMYFESATQAYESMNATALGVDVTMLPAIPADGSTVCLSNCRCNWEITKVFENGVLIGFDCTWRLGISDHCPDCDSRSIDWSPFQIRF